MFIKRLIRPVISKNVFNEMPKYLSHKYRRNNEKFFIGFWLLRPFFSRLVGGQKRLYSSETKNLPGNLTSSVLLDSFGISCCQGKLKKNEDRYDSAILFPGVNYFAVFDGHGGDFSSEFLRRQLAIDLSKTFFPGSALASAGPELMRNAYDRCEQLLEKEIQSSNFDQKTKDHSGSTALAAIISNKTELLIAQTGDSRAILCRSGEAICITTDHTPNNEHETERIENSGGWIDWDTKLVPYVNGILSMTRSFGNCHLRNAGIMHTPFVKHIHLDINDDEFLVICTDGVSDWMTDNEIVSIVSQFEDPNESAHELTCCARQYGSTDDATAFVIPLTAWVNKATCKKKSFANYLRSNTLKRD